MDFQRFCVSNNEKLDLQVPYLQSAVQSITMAKSLKFAPRTFTEERLPGMHNNVEGNEHLSDANISRDGELVPKKDEGHKKLSSVTVSMLVGGFVGTKSYGGCAKKERYQIWNVSMGQVLDTYYSLLNGAALQYSVSPSFSEFIENLVSQNLFSSFCGEGNFTVDIASYFLSENCGILENKKMVGTVCTTAHKVSNVSVMNNIKASSQLPRKDQLNDDFPSLWEECEENNSGSSNTCKQSYADVAKSYALMMPETTSSQIQVPDRRDKYKQELFRLNRRNKDERIDKCVSNKSSSSETDKSSQEKQRIFEDNMKQDPQLKMELNHNESGHFDWFQRKARHLHNQYRVEGYHHHKHRNDVKHDLPSDNRRSKSRHFDVKEKTKRDMEYFVHEEVSYICGMSAEDCENWRQHNQAPRIPFDRGESHVKPANNIKESISPDTTCKWVSESPSQNGDVHTEIISSSETSFLLENGTIAHVSSMKVLLRVEDSIDSSTSLSPQCTLSTCVSSPSNSMDVSGTFRERERISSECSVDSEDSFIVFESEDNSQCGSITEDESGTWSDSDETSSSDDDSVVDNDNNDDDENSDDDDDGDEDEDDDDGCGGDGDASIDCDEVDMCYINPVTCNSDESADEDFGYSAERLEDINKKWQEDNSVVPAEVKVPQKVRFASGGGLATVHNMIKWNFAYHNARFGPWEQLARDGFRFRTRIDRIGAILEPILDFEHRRKVYEQRMCS